VQRRLRSLERDGWVTRYVALVDPQLAHRTFEVFLEVLLQTESGGAGQLFEDAVREIPDVVECHRVTGTSHYLLKVVTRDAASFDRLYSQRIVGLPGLLRTSRQVSLSRVKHTTALPLPMLLRDL